jgi:restriction endonuclease S subunit
MPRQWETFPLSEIADVQKGKTPKAKNDSGDGVPYCSASYLRTGIPDMWISVSEGMIDSAEKDLLILWDGAGAGDVFEGRFGFVSSTMARIRPRDAKRLDRNFLRLFIEMNTPGIKQTCRGTTVPHVNPDYLNTLLVPIPSLIEQSRIVDLVESIDAVIQCTEEAITKTRTARAALLTSLLNPEANSELKSSWALTKLGSVAEIIMGQAPPGSTCNKNGIGTPFVKAGEFHSTRPKLVEWTTNPLKMASRADVLVCVVGATAGKINLGQDCAIGRSVAAVRPSAELRQLFLYYVLSLELNSLRSGSRGSAQAVITRDDLARISFNLPPLEVQQQIMDLIESLSEQLQSLEDFASTARNTRTSILHDLLTGNHEIPESYDRFLEVS